MLKVRMKGLAKRASALAIGVIIGATGAFAQKTTTTEEKISKIGNNSNVSKVTFPNKDARKWIVGVGAGSALFHGDANKSTGGFSLNGHLQYNFSHTIGLRAFYNQGNMSAERTENDSWKGYRMNSDFADYGAMAMITFGNISFLRKQQFINFTLGIGGGGADIKTESDPFRLPSDPVSQPDRVNKFEDQIFFVAWSAGAAFNLAKWLSLSLDYHFRFTRNDNLDALNFPVFANRYADYYVLPQASLQFKIGKKGTQHLTWINPVEAVYTDVSTLKKDMKSLKSDKDADGVSDYFDKDSNTPAGAMVYGNGMAIDSDGDGVPDILDQEPFSPPGAKVNPETGIADDEDGDGVPDILDLSPGTDAKTYITNHQGIPIMTREMNQKLVGAGKTSIGDGGMGYLPAIFFDTDKSVIKPMYMNDIRGVALALKRFPNIKIEVIGNTDTRGGEKYNVELGLRRANTVKEALVKQYGIDAGRLIVTTKGKSNPVAKGSDPLSHAANRRVEFFVTD